MNFLAKIGIAIFGWLGLIEAIVAGITRFNLHYAWVALIGYGIVLGVIGLACLILTTAMWLMDGND